jgi:hypothetical protein
MQYHSLWISIQSHTIDIVRDTVSVAELQMPVEEGEQIGRPLVQVVEKREEG